MHLLFFNKGSKSKAVVFIVVSFIINLIVYYYSKGLYLSFILVVLGALVLVALGVVTIRLISISLTIVLLVSVILLGLTWFTSESLTQAGRHPNTSAAPAQQRSVALEHNIVL